MCRKRHSYEIIIDPGKENDNTGDRPYEHGYIQMIASDSCGFQYGLDTLLQLLQLHSDITIHDATSTATTSTTATDKTVIMHVPCVIISDWPDIEFRAVLWTLRALASPSVSVMNRYVCAPYNDLNVSFAYMCLSTGQIPNYVYLLLLLQSLLLHSLLQSLLLLLHSLLQSLLLLLQHHRIFFKNSY